MKQTETFTQGPIFGPLVRFSVPILLAQFLQALYGAVDLLIVGQFGGELAEVYVSGVSTGSQIMQTLTIVITGIAMGLTVCVGERIGAGRPEEAGKLIGSGIFFFGSLALAVTAAMLLLAPTLTRLMQAPKEAFDATVTYTLICSAGTVFIVAYNLLGSIFRGLGDSKLPLLAVVIACVLNIAGDLLLVAVFRMGAAGAAIATIFAQAASVLLSLLVIRRRKLPFSFSLRDIRFNRRHVRQILKLGVPIALQDLLVGLSFLVIIAIVNKLGLIESAGVGIAEKACIFLMLVPSAFMQSMSAFVAQNIGARKPERAKRSLLLGILTSLSLGVVMGWFTFFHGDLLAGIFAKDREIILPAADYLKAYAFDCVLTSFLFCFIGYFNGCGNTAFVMLQGIAGAVGVRLPVSLLMSRRVPVSLFRIGLATPISSAVQILLCVGYYAFTSRRNTGITADGYLQ